MVKCDNMAQMTYEEAKNLKSRTQVYFDRGLQEGPGEWQAKTGRQSGSYTVVRVTVRTENVLLDLGDGRNWSYTWFRGRKV